MQYSVLRERLLNLFDGEKLQAAAGEWGFYNQRDREIHRVGYATNLTPQVIRKAEEKGVELLLTHHDSWEFVFGLKACCNRQLEESGITHAFFHAPLDDAEFGTSASLAKALEMTCLNKVMPGAGGLYGGVVGEVIPVELKEFTSRLVAALHEPVRCFRNNRRPVQKVAVAAGGGNLTGDMKAAVEEGCDTYVTGEYALYSLQYARLCGMNLLVGSHTNTELPGVRSMTTLLTRGTDLEMVQIQEPND